MSLNCFRALLSLSLSFVHLFVFFVLVITLALACVTFVLFSRFFFVSFGICESRASLQTCELKTKSVAAAFFWSFRL